MCPKKKVPRHPAGEELLKYATEGCPVDCNRNGTMYIGKHTRSNKSM